MKLPLFMEETSGAVIIFIGKFTFMLKSSISATMMSWSSLSCSYVYNQEKMCTSQNRSALVFVEQDVCLAAAL